VPEAHALHATPEAPHDMLLSADGASHVPIAVQQPGHDVPPQVHCPLEQDSLLPQALHAAPPVPHWPDVCVAYGTQAPVAEQQPLEQDVASQAHCPVLVSQAEPVPHAAQAAPPKPHCVADSEAYGTHAPVPSQQPLGHVLELQPIASAPVSEPDESAVMTSPLPVSSDPSIAESAPVLPSPPSQSPPAHAPSVKELRPSRAPHAARVPPSMRSTRTATKVRT
jgi:hypothetical protein